MPEKDSQGHSSELDLLLEDAISGNKEAFNRFCTEYAADRLLMFIRSILPNRLRAKIDAEDILQDTLDQAWRCRGKLRNVSARGFLKWSCSIARNRVHDIVRHYYTGGHDVDREEKSPRPPEDSAFKYDRTASDSVVRREHVELVVEALNELMPDERQVIVHRSLEGCSVKETAALMNKTETWISVKLHRALISLNDILRGRGFTSSIFSLH